MGYGAGRDVLPIRSRQNLRDPLLQAKAQAMMAGISSARKIWTTTIVYIDSTKIIQLLHNPKSVPINCYYLVLDILEILQSFASCSVEKVGRTCISKAHDLAIQARKGQ
ncbi:putative potassium transport system protein kup 1 [Bienertia sinuspersici]